MKTVNVHEAKTHLSRLLGDVELGEEITIARSGVPIARLVPVDRPCKRVLGEDRGKVWIADDFDEFIPPEFEPYVGKARSKPRTRSRG